MSECRKECICLQCALHQTKSCEYGDCEWCKGKDGITRCRFFKEEDYAEFINLRRNNK